MTRLLTVQVLQCKQIDIEICYPAQLLRATDQLYVFSKIYLYFNIKLLKRIFVALTHKKVVELQVPCKWQGSVQTITMDQPLKYQLEISRPWPKDLHTIHELLRQKLQKVALTLGLHLHGIRDAIVLPMQSLLPH